MKVKRWSLCKSCDYYLNSLMPSCIQVNNKLSVRKLLWNILQLNLNNDNYFRVVRSNIIYLNYAIHNTKCSSNVHSEKSFVEPTKIRLAQQNFSFKYRKFLHYQQKRKKKCNYKFIVELKKLILGNRQICYGKMFCKLLNYILFTATHAWWNKIELRIK